MPVVPPSGPRLRAGVRRLALALALAGTAALPAVVPTTAAAQVVERPEPFDSAGRLVAITPPIAARLQLGPPAWRITGDYREARLYALGNEGYVVVVTRRDGSVERYSLTVADRDYLRERTRNLPPGLEQQIAGGIADVVRTVRSEARTAFVRDQTLLGFGVYAPSFAYAVTNATAGRIATYLLVAGGSFFAASSLSREIAISSTQNRLATLGALHGGAAGFGVMYALDAPRDGRAVGVLVGSLAGTAAGLYFGRDVTPAQVASMAFGADAAAVAAAGFLGAGGVFNERDRTNRIGAAALVGAAALGAPLGAMYPRRVSYNVTAGDVSTLWVTGGLGALGATTFIANGSPSNRTVLLALTSGFLAGTVAGDRLLVKRLDHTPGDAALVGLGTAAGALMGAGVSVLVKGDDDSNDALAAALATAGGIAGLGTTSYLLAVKPDAGRFASRLRFSPSGLAMAAAKMPGDHPVLSFTF